uniref:Caspase-related protein n=1 Tax=Suberites domuncula TaxID=55567 RepID=Q8I749_SUBDO|nr:caspase-related protein [Suberites domuncula]
MQPPTEIFKGSAEEQELASNLMDIPENVQTDSCAELEDPFLQSAQPFGLTFDPFKNDSDGEYTSIPKNDTSLTQQEQLLHRLGQSTSKIANKEDQIAKLQKEIKKQQERIETQVRGHVDQMQHILNTIQGLETLASTPCSSDMSSIPDEQHLEKQGGSILESAPGPSEQDIEQYHLQIQGLQQHMESIAVDYQDRERSYLAQLQQYEDDYKTMSREADSYRLEVDHLHRELASATSRSHQSGDEFYPMNKNPHGICLIINNHQFYHSDPEKCHSNRGGAHIDVHNLTQTFKYLRYKVEVVENISSSEMNKVMLRKASEDHPQYDSFVCIIMTQGGSNIVHGADSEAVNLYDLTGVMKMCPTLRGKPKIFFVQACRGDIESMGFKNEEVSKTEDDLQADMPGGHLHTDTIPQEADFFYGFATPLGYAAYRSRRHGSWYISELCQVFIKHPFTHSLGSMMKKVNNRVSKAYTKDGYKQCTEFVDRLRFEVHFFRFIHV